MPLPTGPAVVGLEPVVLPCTIVEGIHAPWPFAYQIEAPRCRYGQAWYRPVFMAGSETLFDRRAGLVDSGDRIDLYATGGMVPSGLELRPVEIDLQPGALTGCTTEEFLGALTHPLPYVRERATHDAAEAAKRAYRREKHARSD